MRAKITIVGVALLALLLFTAPRAFGCVPDDGDSSRCVYFVASNHPTPTVAALKVASVDPPAQPTPTGNSPETARTPMWVKPQYCIEAMCPGAVNAPPLNAPGNWTWIAPNSSTWYKMDDGRSLQVDVWLFANGQSGLSFDVYAPEQKDLWGSKPIGRGAFDKSQANVGVDLFYTGRSVAYGVWYVRVNNGNSFPVSYSLRFTRTTPTGLRNVCEGCHSGNMDWGSCQGSMCADLHSLYDTNPQCYNHDASAQLADGGGCN